MNYENCIFENVLNLNYSDLLIPFNVGYIGQRNNKDIYSWKYMLHLYVLLLYTHPGWGMFTIALNQLCVLTVVFCPK